MASMFDGAARENPTVGELELLPATSLTGGS
jgi:hypothetical protein